MTSQKTLIENFKDFEPARVVRNGQSYQETYNFIQRELSRYLKEYNKMIRMNQTARLIRDQIDNLLRRYHDYIIQGQFGAHYRQVGLQNKRGNVFEHVIPARTVRNMLISGIITIPQALNSPTCIIDPEHNTKLRTLKLTKRTPNAWLFWQRYKDLDINIETFDRKAVEQATWSLETHWKYFDIQDQHPV